jgi:muramoyltetrapeptide carboxypeptidase LdcA involved in peptidoglycan recycling
MSFTTPPAVPAGGTVALVAPATPIAELHVERLRDRLDRRFELELRSVGDVTADERLDPETRVDALVDAYRDDGVDAVLAATGGNDQIRLLDLLDDRLDRETAASKRFFGYSDNDNVRLWLWTHGIVSYGSTAHPDLVVGDDLHPYTERFLSRALFEESLGTVEPPERWTDEWYDFDSDEPDDRDWHDADPWYWEGEEVVSGPVWGGSLAIVEWQLMAGRWLPDPERLDGAVLALESAETMPVPRRFRYLLRSLGERGWLDRFDGVLIGRPRSGTPTVDRETAYEPYRDAVREAVRGPLANDNPDATVAFEVDFGHTEPRFPLPLGATATLDPVAERLIFE